MERNDVIKALECCAAPVTRCDECPVDKAKKDDCVCGVYVAGEALKVIEKLTQAKEMLSESYDHLEKTKDELLAERSRLTEENERLKAQRYVAYSDRRIEMIPTVESVKSDTVRKMQERFKMYFGTYFLGYKIPLSEALKAVNQIAKEMLDGGKSK